MDNPYLFLLKLAAFILMFDQRMVLQLFSLFPVSDLLFCVFILQYVFCFGTNIVYRFTDGLSLSKLSIKIIFQILTNNDRFYFLFN